MSSVATTSDIKSGSGPSNLPVSASTNDGPPGPSYSSPLSKLGSSSGIFVPGTIGPSGSSGIGPPAAPMPCPVVGLSSAIAPTSGLTFLVGSSG